jgi:hypothetical protein
MHRKADSVRAVRKSLLLGATGLVLYAAKVRPWLLSWGATPEDLADHLPGDDIVAAPRCTSTRAIDIAADPEDVWPWLAQLGQGRGGLYSYEWLENLFGCEIHNVDHVVPELQTIRPGDRVRLVPEDFKVDLAFEVADAVPDHALVLKGLGTRKQAFEMGFAYPSWAFVIKHLEGQKVKLIARWRSDFPPTPAAYIWWKYGIEPVHFLMERKMLKGIKQRAESLAERSRLAATSIPVVAERPGRPALEAAPS